MAKTSKASEHDQASTPPWSSRDRETETLVGDSAVPKSRRRDSKLPSLDGRYSIKRILGEGGFGRVYLADDRELQRPVAIKVPHAYRIEHPEDAEKYIEEARLVAKLDHPAIVPVYDVQRTADGRCFVVSKFIEGSDLAEAIKTSSVPFRSSAQLIAKIADALHFAHTHGVVHRDIKPSNILVDRSRTPYLADFGLALREEDFGKGGAVLSGTPGYMSPEQARGDSHCVDGRSDIFSLGVVMYELLTRRRPFQGKTASDVMDQIIKIDARPLRQLNDSIPKEIERICLKALSKRAVDRYTTAKDFADDLRDYLAGRTPATTKSWAGRKRMAAPESATNISSARTRRSPRRPWIWTAGCSILGGVMAMILLALLLGNDAGAEKEKSENAKSIASSPEPVSSPSNIVIPSGVLKFRTERFERVAVTGDHVILVDTHPATTHELELAFQVINDSDQLFTISALTTQLLGLIKNFEDAPPEHVDYIFDHMLHESRQIYTVDRRRADLGNLDFSWHQGNKTVHGASGNLLHSEVLEVLKPHSIRSFVVRIHCNGTDLVPIELLGESRLARLLSGGPRLLVGGLWSLDSSPPKTFQAIHAFALLFRLLSDDGDPVNLYSDCIYTVEPQLDLEKQSKVDSEQIVLLDTLPLKSWTHLAPEQFTDYAIDTCVKTLGETLAYEWAGGNRMLRLDVDPNAVAPYCFWRDASSPLRRFMVRPDAMIGLPTNDMIIDLNTSFEMNDVRQHPRTNLPDVFRDIREQHADLWKPVGDQLQRLASQKQTTINRNITHFDLGDGLQLDSELASQKQNRIQRKASFVLQELSKPESAKSYQDDVYIIGK